jgi:hypothetical protein
MEFKKFVPACVGAALSLAVAAFGSGASAADMPSFKMPPPPPPAPTLDIHGFFDVTFANDYITPRGLLVTNSGLTTQLLSGLVFDLYKNPNGFVNNFNVYAGVWNDLWSKQDHPQVGSWNEFDWFVGLASDLPSTGKSASNISSSSARLAPSARSETSNWRSRSMTAH